MLAPNYLPEAHHALIAELAGSLESPSLHWLSGYFAGIAQARQPAREAAPGTEYVVCQHACAQTRGETILMCFVACVCECYARMVRLFVIV